MLSAPLCHLDVLHLLFNCASLLGVGAGEASFGALW
jgi:membrane associated rhomboid family serine protease